MVNFKRAVGVGIILSSALVLSACYHSKTSSSQTSTTRQENPRQATDEVEEGVVVKVTEDGFSPAQVTVQSGSNLTYKNSGSAKVQIASDPHPVHTANSELTDGDFVIELAPGRVATVTLTRSGTWGIHDHLNPGMRGKVVVE